MPQVQVGVGLAFIAEDFGNGVLCLGDAFPLGMRDFSQFALVDDLPHVAEHVFGDLMVHEGFCIVLTVSQFIVRHAVFSCFDVLRF
jgi:hypothetical protein